jgi:hypothetical protein
MLGEICLQNLEHQSVRGKILKANDLAALFFSFAPTEAVASAVTIMNSFKDVTQGQMSHDFGNPVDILRCCRGSRRANAS